jgi:hypothetical protein
VRIRLIDFAHGTEKYSSSDPKDKNKTDHYKNTITEKREDKKQ